MDLIVGLLAEPLPRGFGFSDTAGVILAADTNIVGNRPALKVSCGRPIAAYDGRPIGAVQNPPITPYPALPNLTASPRPDEIEP